MSSLFPVTTDLAERYQDLLSQLAKVPCSQSYMDDLTDQAQSCMTDAIKIQNEARSFVQRYQGLAVHCSEDCELFAQGVRQFLELVNRIGAREEQQLRVASRIDGCYTRLYLVKAYAYLCAAAASQALEAVLIVEKAAHSLWLKSINADPAEYSDAALLSFEEFEGAVRKFLNQSHVRCLNERRSGRQDVFYSAWTGNNGDLVVTLEYLSTRQFRIIFRDSVGQGDSLEDANARLGLKLQAS